MSVPLDRLYNFLQRLCNRDIIIYRWTPHGSRNLGDLQPLGTEFIHQLNVLLTIPAMVCHDQEPLNYNYWTQDEFVQSSKLLNKESDFVANQFSHWHLRSILQCGHKAHVFKDTLLCHSELNSKELDKYTQNNFVGVYYWAHALIARDWYRYAQLDQTLKQKNVQHDFLVYNRAWQGTREYRLKFAELIVQQNLHQCCRMGFNDHDDNIHYHNHEFTNTNMQITSQDLEQYFFKNNSMPSASADYNACDYQNTAIEVVLETLFDDDRLHLTEKSLRPIACGQPFILAATPGSLAYLRSYGFKTFASIIDESYDTIDNPVQRLAAIVDLMNNIKNNPKRLEMYQQLQAIADFNQQRFFSSDFHQQIVDEFKQNFSNGFDKVLKSCTAEYMEQYVDAKKQTQEYCALPTANNHLQNLRNWTKYVYDFIDRTTSESNIRSNLPMAECVHNQ